MNSSTNFVLIARILHELNRSEIEPKETINFVFDGKFHRYRVSSDPATHSRGWFVGSEGQIFSIAFGNLQTGLNINISIPVSDKMLPSDWFNAYRNQLSATMQRQKFILSKKCTLNVINYWFHVIVLKHTSLEMEIQYV